MDTILSTLLPFLFFFLISRFFSSLLTKPTERRRTVEAMIVRKRESCTLHHHGVEFFSDHNSSKYFVTFQLDKNHRVELQVKEKQYDLLYDGERGKLTYHGRHFIRFRPV